MLHAGLAGAAVECNTQKEKPLVKAAYRASRVLYQWKQISDIDLRVDEAERVGMGRAPLRC